MTETRTYTAENWRKLAGIRQGVINRLEKKLARVEAEAIALRASLDAVSARLALYDGRERA